MEALVDFLAFESAYGYGYGLCDAYGYGGDGVPNPEDIGCIFLNFFKAEEGNLLLNNLILNIAGTGIALTDANVTVRNNTIHNSRFYGLTTTRSYSVVENNIINDYRTSAIKHDTSSLMSAFKNDMFSRFIEETEEAVGAVDTDFLTVPVESTTTVVLIVNDGSKFSRDQLIEIGSEKMTIETVFSNRLTVLRAQEGTVATTHARGTEVKIFEPEVVFTITGIDADRVRLRQTDGLGNIILRKPSVELISIDDNTFRASFFVNRRVAFNYRYDFVPTGGTEFAGLTANRILRSQQFGNAVNDIENAIQELTGNDSRNYSDDPLFFAPEFDNFDLQPSSPANVLENPTYTDISDPTNVVNRYAGSLDVTIDEQPLIALAFNDTTFETALDPVILLSPTVEITVRSFVDTTRTLPVLSYVQDTNIGTLAAPVEIDQIGLYSLQYKRPVNLGTSLSPFNNTGAISYIFDEGRDVDFTSVEFTEALEGGQIAMQFRIAGTQEDLTNQVFSSPVISSPANLLDSEGEVPRAKVIEVVFTLSTNDGGFLPDGTPVYPILEDFAVKVTPGSDTVRYSVLEVRYSSATDITEVDIQAEGQPGEGIQPETFEAVGEDSRLHTFVEKLIGSFGPPILVAESDELASGITTISLFGDITRPRTLPASNDIVQADLVIINRNQSETLVFLEDGTQITTNRFQGVDSITVEIIEDRRTIEPDQEQISVNTTNQPEAGESYFTTYDIVAPKEGETITVDFSFNAAVQTTQATIEDRRDIVADVLVRGAFEVPVAIEANIVSIAGQDPTSVVTQVTAAIAQNVTDLSSFGAILTPSSTVSAIQGVAGVLNVVLTRHSKDTESGINIVQLTNQEILTLAANQPVVIVTPEGQVDTSNVRVI